ncbi:DNA polymerase III subunit alpha [Williamwhitmania taraxaci]|uniref:DNA-directed DNA polymerase n=1 Tax=Williamwhitmania taraxaci TaxID=1640674 RepID=A0A1G6QJK5_9BACT|nr:DNA polymerase III subunit alpha [Williamwhitmania taraxaci]SDC92662.1 DNA polymerase-3 subunit alpha [Williamwhitmania taraxaci]
MWITKSYNSLLYGTLPVEQLVAMAKTQGLQSLALTDINTSQGVMDFYKHCTQNGIKPLAGVEFRDGNHLLYTAIAKNLDGFREINEILSQCKEVKSMEAAKDYKFQNAFTLYPYGSRPVAKLRDGELITVRPSDVNRVRINVSAIDQCKMVALAPVAFADAMGYELHRHLRAMEANTLLSKLTPEMLAAADEVPVSPDDLRHRFASLPLLIENAELLADCCSLTIDLKGSKNKQTFTGSRYDDQLLLEKLAFDGLEYRYGRHDKVAVGRVQKELKIINDLNFSAYFLITWDIIRYSMSRGFYHVGRGSGANSVVAYCLRITDVDPIELNLYFERFLNPKRTSPPDFDIDYSWKDRDQVQDYIFKRYGKRHTALLGATVTFQGSSIVRELGKVYGLPKEEIDKIADGEVGEKERDHIVQRIFSIGSQLVDFPHVRSIHAGGVLVSEEPITTYTSLEMPPKGFPTTEWDMYVAEEIGFEKLDILSQRGIGHIKEAVDIIRANRGDDIDAHRVQQFKKDPKVKEQLQNGETIGCFYVESPAMRGLLKKLRCNDYLTLVAASSIIRPGVAKSGMMREYIQRFHNPTGFKYSHPVMEEQLGETYGVMVYQEDVLKVCHHFAGLDLADADILRRAMSGKFRSKGEFKRIEENFFNGAKELGRPQEVAQDVWRQVESFAGYSFSKAHSASYAVESFQSLYLKAHYPLEFMVAVINNFGGFYRTWVYFNEARRWGATINLPCVNQSTYTTCIYGTNIYVGFIHIANLEADLAHRIVTEREKNGLYQSLGDFTRRIGIGIEQLIILIRINAFRFTGKPKVALLWEAHTLLDKRKPEQPGGSLFHIPEKEFHLPHLEETIIEDIFDEIELLGFPVTLTWFDLLKTKFRGGPKARELPALVGHTIKTLGLLVHIKYVRTKHGQLMHFGTFLDLDGQFFDTLHFPDSLSHWPFKGTGVYLLQGVVTEEFSQPSITISKMAKLEIQPDPRAGK